MENRDTRHANRIGVLRSVLAHGRTSRREIIDESGLSKATVSRLVRALVEDGVIAEGPVISGPAGGRSTRTIEFKGDAGLVCGIDIGGTTTRFVLTDQRARLVAAWRLPSPQTSTAAEVAGWIADEVLSACTRNGGQSPAVTVVGVPGVVDGDGSQIRFSPNLPMIEGTDFARSLAERLPGRHQIENDSNLALVGELCAGAAAGCRNAVMITVGTGVGAGVALDGKLLRGQRGLVGEFGMLPVELDGTTLEDVVSGLGISTAAHALGLAETDAAAVLSSVGPGPQAALRARVLSALYASCVAASVAYEPEMIVFGGGVSESLAGSLPGLRERLAEVLDPVPQLSVSLLGDPAGALGAVAAGLEAAYQLLADDVDGEYGEQVRRDVTTLAGQLSEQRGRPAEPAAHSNQGAQQ